MRDSVPSPRYSPVCNVLRQWKTSLIPTYRFNRLFDIPSAKFRRGLHFSAFHYNYNLFIIILKFNFNMYYKMYMFTLLINPRCMHSEGYSSCRVCMCVCVCVYMCVCVCMCDHS